MDLRTDFRIGGREVSKGGPRGGPVHSFESRYYDIVPNERIVYAYERHMDDKRISVPVATIELKADGQRTRLELTEQGARIWMDSTTARNERKERAGCSTRSGNR